MGYEMNKTSSIMQDIMEIRELEQEMNHTCQFCESTWTEFDRIIKQYWCNDCQRWDDPETDEESRESIARSENAILDTP
jgi:ribosomal protein L37AE/L43A